MDGATERVGDELVRAVEDRWRKTGTATLLSQVGKLFGQELGDLARGRKLIEVLREDFADRLKLVSHGEGNSTVWGVVPASVPEPEGRKVIPAAVGAGSASAAQPRFDRVIWAAFRAELPPGQRRHVWEENGVYRFADRPASEDAPNGLMFSIEPGEVAPGDASVADVVGWIARAVTGKGIDPERVLAARDGLTSRKAGAPTARRQEGSLLHAVMAALSPSDQRRVTLPLDVVAKLLETKAG